MIIVSQDEETIINFNNIIAITQKDGEIGVTEKLLSEEFSVIGEYETKERAMEVLREITGNWEQRPMLAYYMPKE